MKLLYCDESNLESRNDDFFLYGGIVVDSVKAAILSSKIDEIRAAAGVEPQFLLKFNPSPPGLSHDQFLNLKGSIIDAAIEHSAGLLTSIILHNIATSPANARRNEINRVCFHFNSLLNRANEPGLVLIDRFSDQAIDAHLVEKFAVGLVGLPYTRQMRLTNIVGFHYSAIGQSHFTSLIDIILGSLRFSLNAFTRADAARLDAAKRILRRLEPFFLREGANSPVSELSFFFSPKTITSPAYRAKYNALKGFLAEAGIDTAQSIVER